MSELMVLPLRAVQIGDKLPFGQQVIDKFKYGALHDPYEIELQLLDGVTMKGKPDTTLTVTELAMTVEIPELGGDYV